MTGEALTDETVGIVAVGARTVRRLGYGAMRVSGVRDGAGVRDRASAVALVRRLLERGVELYDGANIYGYGECEEILGTALRGDDVLVATKAGFRPGKLAPGQRSLPAFGRPEHIREECDKSLRRLGVDRIDLYQVHVPDPDVPYEETVGAFIELQRAGKVRDVGVSNVTTAQLRTAQGLCEVVSVQNSYGLGNDASEEVLEVCTREGIAFMPHSSNHLPARAEAVVAEVARARGVSGQQVASAWVLQHSPVVLAIPGTSSRRHADDNVDAAFLRLSEDEVRRLDAVHGDAAA